MLCPDIANKAGKRVIIKVDGRSGRLNEEMLADLRLMGEYYFQVPRTRHKQRRKQIEIIVSSNQNFALLYICCTFVAYEEYYNTTYFTGTKHR